MDYDKAQQVLDELKGVRPEYLNEDAKRLFEAIMTIADERDMYRRQVNDAFNRGWIHKDKIKRKIEQAKQKADEDNLDKYIKISAWQELLED